MFSLLEQQFGFKLGVFKHTTESFNNLTAMTHSNLVMMRLPSESLSMSMTHYDDHPRSALTV